ncbi:hypothetical protein ABW21_db0203375 [Orbilia brochopaga]|nr:hypothetical protein ABW21_db0203375 [Drechslerella brochopaga]
MATAVYPKIKLSTPKPPLGVVMTNASTPNHAIPRPSPTPSKTLPSPTMTTSITLATPTNGNTPAAPTTNGVRTSERRRGAPNKIGTDTSLHARLKNARSADVDEDGDSLALNQPPRKKLKPMPRVITTQYILDKYKDKPPSLTLHMHPTHFRFDQQDGTFNYNSAMKSILEYIAQEIIPADAVEVFRDARLPFYEGRLIVHIHDHRTSAKDVEGGNVKPKNDKLFSLNKWNEHLTPSPFVPYPEEKLPEVKKEPTTNGNMRPMEAEKGASKPLEETRRIFKTVLHPTPASLHAEICLLALTPAVPPNARGRPASVAQTPATPSSAHPLTVSTNNKPLPMILNDKTALTFEADYLLATGPSLVLTPAESPEHAAAIIEALKHPLHSRPVPPKKTRKRTVKEMAVDEAKAAEEERLMLIMDERHLPSAIGATDDGAVNSGGFEPSFKRWKALESIKQKYDEEKAKEKQLSNEKMIQQERERQKALKAPVTAQTPTSAPQTTATQGSPIAAASSPYAFHGSPPMQSRTSNHSSQPGSRQQSPHMSNVQSVQHQHHQPMPSSPAMHASPMMRATSQAMHNSPAMNQGSPLARNIGMVPGLNTAALQAAQHTMMMQNAARNQQSMLAKQQQLVGASHLTPDQQKLMVQRTMLIRQQQHAMAIQAAQAQAQAQAQQQQQNMMDGMGGPAGIHPAMAGRGFMPNMAAANGMHMNGVMGGMPMNMNGYAQIAMLPNGMPVGMVNGMNPALQGYNPAQINMLMRGRGQPPQGQ